jgi:hypothetical protein
MQSSLPNSTVQQVNLNEERAEPLGTLPGGGKEVKTLALALDTPAANQ